MEIVLKVLEVLAAVAPGFLALFSGKETDAEAIAHARELLDKVPIRVGPDGVWTADLERRKREP